MILFLHVIYDSVSKVYDVPFPSRSEEEAIRSFGNLASNAETMVGKHPEHFKLFRVGLYDDSTGKIAPEDIVHVANAHDLVAAGRKVEPGQLDAFDKMYVREVDGQLDDPHGVVDRAAVKEIN